MKQDCRQNHDKSRRRIEKNRGGREAHHADRPEIAYREEKKTEKAGPDKTPEVFCADTELARIREKNQDAETDGGNPASHDHRPVRINSVLRQVPGKKTHETPAETSAQNRSCILVHSVILLRKQLVFLKDQYRKSLYA